MRLKALTAAGGSGKDRGAKTGLPADKRGNDVKIHFSLLTASSVLFDAVYVPGGAESIATLKTDPAALEFIAEAYKHAKAIALLRPAPSYSRPLRAVSIKRSSYRRTAGLKSSYLISLQKLRSIATGTARKC